MVFRRTEKKLKPIFLAYKTFSRDQSLSLLINEMFKVTSAIERFLTAIQESLKETVI